MVPRQPFVLVAWSSFFGMTAENQRLDLAKNDFGGNTIHSIHRKVSVWQSDSVGWHLKPRLEYSLFLAQWCAPPVFSTHTCYKAPSAIQFRNDKAQLVNKVVSISVAKSWPCDSQIAYKKLPEQLAKQFSNLSQICHIVSRIVKGIDLHCLI